MQTLLGVPLPEFARRRWTACFRGKLNTGGIVVTVAHLRAPTRVAYLAALLAVSRQWE
jgi:hypothetical protein